MPVDHYQTLGVPRSAQIAEIRASYLALARAYHPDFHVRDDPSSQEMAAARMREINASWTVLSDERRRRDYDRELARTPRPTMAEIGSRPPGARRRRAGARSARLESGRIAVVILCLAGVATSTGALVGSVVVLTCGLALAVAGGAVSLSRRSA